MSWGIELPFDSKFVTYVWFDALLNYLIATGWPGPENKAGVWNQDLWSEATHLIGKDIVIPHCVYWATMLLALRVPMFRQVQANGYVLIDGSKMSKSFGNVVRPLDLEERFGKDTVRFFLLREISYGLDSSFTLEGYVNCVNAYLANGIGNLTSRVMTLVSKNFDAEVFQFAEDSLLDSDRALLQKRAELLKTWETAFSELKYQTGLKAWTELVTAVDLYVNDMKPWALAKDSTQKDRLATVLGCCLQVIQTLGVAIYPVLPHASRGICTALGLDQNPATDLSLAVENRFSYRICKEVPKLFMRVQLPTE